MLALTSSESSALLPLPQARVPLNIRQAVLSDLPFIDRLQKMHTKAVGWMPTNQLEGSIKLGRVLVAWASRPCDSQDMGETPMLREEPVGYLLAADRYFKRDDVGIIYQMNVLPERQRGLVAASLLKAQFERSAYGCKLYCCWCAQDLAANKFWEAMGFVPLAFRTGGTASKKDGPRLHIFWQKRIRQGDETTPWWFPSETSSGAIRENRIVLPIPPGTHWSDAKPIVLPSAGNDECGMMKDESKKVLPGKRVRVKVVKAEPIKQSCIASGGLRFADPKPVMEKVEKPKREKHKNDPRLVAAARELKDRWLEQVNREGLVIEERGKYDVSRQIQRRPDAVEDLPLLTAA